MTYRSRKLSRQSRDLRPKGSVKAVNRKIKHNLKMKLKNLKGRWAIDLPKVLYASRTTTRSTTGETPFSLPYRYKAMVLVELGARSLRGDNFNLEQNMIL